MLVRGVFAVHESAIANHFGSDEPKIGQFCCSTMFFVLEQLISSAASARFSFTTLEMAELGVSYQENNMKVVFYLI